MRFLIKDITLYSDDYYKDYYEKLNIYQKRKINKLKDSSNKKLTLLALIIISNELQINIKDIHYNRGKPYIKNNPYISITHKYPFVGVAISKKSIGIDIEILKEINQVTLNYLKCKNNIEALIKWTRKESIYKCGDIKNKKVRTIILNKKVILSICN